MLQFAKNAALLGGLFAARSTPAGARRCSGPVVAPPAARAAQNVAGTVGGAAQTVADTVTGAYHSLPVVS